MTKPPPQPPFPIDLGSWLACFRYRLRGEDGQPASPEQVAQELGVSGATVRRWEGGSAQPRPQDIVNLARVYGLSPLQLAFLNRALMASDVVVPPDPALFRRTAESVLKTDVPAYLLDDLYNTRAWNPLVDLLPITGAVVGEGHFVELVFGIPAREGEQEARRYRRRRLVRDFWMLTADHCGHPQYRRLLTRLGRDAVFRAEWTSLALDDDAQTHEPIGAPYVLQHATSGSFKAIASQVVLPPAYHLRLYVPADEKAEALLREARKSRPLEIQVDPRVHWAQA